MSPDLIKPITGLASAQVQIWGLVFLRMASFFVLVPVVGASNTPRQVKAGLALVLSLAIYPTLPRTAVPLAGNSLQYFGMALGEIFVGLLAGWIFAMVFQVMEIAGAFIDAQAGYSMVELLDPSTGDSTHLFGQFLIIAATVSFVLAGLHAHLVAVLVESYRIVPVATASPDAAGLLQVASTLVSQAMSMGLRLAGPVLMALLLATVVLAVVSRIMPSMNTWILAMPLQIAIACGVVAFGLPQILTAWKGWENTLYEAVRASLRLAA